MVCSANLQMLFSWDQTTGTATNGDLVDVIAELTETAPASITANGLSPPQPPTMVHAST
ncbi:hypothetical protein OG311_16405 [Streptomyces sp. NBC_01343]|uniref:hypothetical protein n=1 Tax=Streptomyces sp. NBC_01343 TaxID=2903832 RepID=UPI002E0FE39C|nr:hypothetical protein OG311_16405 [Streptomyces sp. NBC_01343]